MQKTILKFSLFLLTLGVAFFAWWSIDAAINVPDASVWGTTTMWFSVLFILLSLSAVLIKEFYLVLLEVFFALFLSLLFVVSVGHFVLTIFALLFMLLAISKMRGDLHLNIRVSLWKTIRAGSTIMIFALSLVITSQYYFTVKDFGVEKIIPKFKMQGLSSALTSKILSAMNPDFKNLNDDGLTVDQLILEIQKKQMPGEKLPAALSGQLDRMALEEGRKQLSQIIGTKVTGQEKVADLFSEAVNNKISEYIVPNIAGDGSFPILQFIMSIILFLTVMPLGSFLSPLWILIVSLIFRAIVGAGLVTIKKVMTEVEVLE